MMTVEIAVEEGELRPGIPRRLFDRRFMGATPLRAWDVTPDGQRFLMIQWYPKEATTRLNQFSEDKVSVVLNWFEELGRLVPTDQ